MPQSQVISSYFCFSFVLGYGNDYANEVQTKEKLKLPEMKN